MDGLSQLEPDLRAAVVLRDIQGLSTIEAAESLDISVPALKSRLHRARVLLRKYLSRYIERE
jgi:RNA polymerase sigma-70 factor (ECF subfamily)